MAKAISLTGALDLFPKSVKLVKEHWGMFLFVTIIPLVMTLLSTRNTGKELDVTNFNVGALLESAFGVGTEVVAVLFVLSFVVQVMATGLEIDVANKRKPSLGGLWDYAVKYTFRYLGLVIVSTFIIAVGLLAFIVPGVIAITRFMYAFYAMMDEDLSISAALRRSAEITKGRWGAVWGVVFVGLLVSAVPQIILGFISPVVAGVASTLAALAYVVAPALRYFELKKLAK